jgi:GTP-binding protein
MELKDLIWTEINKESNKVTEISHRPMEIAYREVDDEELEEEYEEEDEEDDLSKYKGIGWDEL